MGVDYSVYVGPFLRCRFSDTTAHETIRTCKNKSCGSHGFHVSTPHCPQCGHPVGEVEREVKSAPDYSEVVGDDVFYELHTEGADKDNEHWLAPNRKVQNIERDLHLDSRTDLGLAFADDEDVIANEKLDFVAQHRSEIEKLRRA